MSHQSKANFSLEFFPPKTPEGAEKLRVARATLAELHPAYFSVTFGAGGSTQKGTLETVLEIRREGHEAAPHLSCMGSSLDSLRTILHAYKSHGIKRIVALRGDMPSGHGPGGFSSGEFRYASELVEFIRAETGDWFHIDVAAYPEMHPQARSPQDDLQHFVHKVGQGPIRRSRSIFIMPTLTFASSTMQPKPACRCRLWPASCRSPIIRN